MLSVDSINLSKLDFKEAIKTFGTTISGAINLSKLDFKGILHNEFYVSVEAINLSKLDFKDNNIQLGCGVTSL